MIIPRRRQMLMLSVFVVSLTFVAHAPSQQPSAVATPHPLAVELPWGEMRMLDASLELTITTKPAGRAIEIPRLNNRIGQVYLQGDEEKRPLALRPGVKTWSVQLPPMPQIGMVVIVETKEPPQLPRDAMPVSADDHGDLILPAHRAITHGTTLRYEPQPHKNTVGYWANVKDWCEWNFRIEQPGRYAVHILQGCGKGQGDSEVDVIIGDAKLSLVVEDTGHFQNFKSRNIGEVELSSAGVHQLAIRARKKAKKAVVDVREVRLVKID